MTSDLSEGVVCVTGGLGFIGSRLCEVLLGQGRPVRCVDDLSGRYAPGGGEAAARRLAARGAEVVRGHVGRLPAGRVLDGAAALLHLAALPGVRTARSFADLWTRNALLAERLARSAARRGVRIVLASTSSVYGDAVRLPTPEHAPPSPLGPYALTKLAAENACLREADAVVVRLFTVYGPGQRPDMAFARWIRSLRERRPLPWHAPVRGARDFTYVDDAVAGLIAALERGRGGETYNVSGHRPVAVRDALALVEAAVGRRAALHRMPARPGEATVTAGCPRKAATELAYLPRTPLAEGIERQVAAARAAIPGRPPGARARAHAGRSRAGWGFRAGARG